jgi:predicted dithiol-disulfide oxidoreductase (DUF899 family)
MSESKHSVRFPGESQSYRAARDELLDLEIGLRRKIESVAARRRSLPLGGKVTEDYAFDRLSGDSTEQVRLSDLFSEDKSRRYDLASVEFVRSNAGRSRREVVSAAFVLRVVQSER